MPTINCGNLKVKGSKQAIADLIAFLAPKPREHSVRLVYLETCTSDYFLGFSGQVYAADAAGKARNNEVKHSLIRAIHAEELWIDGVSAPACDYDLLHEQAIDLFRGIHPLKRWSIIECGEDCYAYFGVQITYLD